MIRKVIDNDMCIGCGACAVISPHAFSVYEEERGIFQAKIIQDNPEEESKASRVCPFSDNSKNEEELSNIFLKQAELSHSKIGRHIQCYAGRVTDPLLYQKSSSGGIGRWLIKRLFEEGEVNYAIHVSENTPRNKSEMLYSFSVASSVEEVISGSKSAYYPVEMTRVLRYAIENPGRYVITGVPCFIKAVRNLMLEIPILSERIRYTIGIVCGHLKGRYYAEMIGWQLGVHPDNLAGLDFRVKLPGKRANEKGCRARSIDKNDLNLPSKTVKELFGTDYGHGYFKYNACDYCDDVVAEAADVSIGDAWLPKYMNGGTSIVVARNKRLTDIINSGCVSGELMLDCISAEDVAQSQAGGLRHRREGLSYRLYLRKTEGKWAPKKRVDPETRHLTRRQKEIFRYRMILANSSFSSFQKAKKSGDFAVFEKEMETLNSRYRSICMTRLKSSLPYVILKRIAAVFRK